LAGSRLVQDRRLLGRRQATVRAAKVALDEAGIGIPFPQQDVHLDEAVIKALSN
jgi:small-conductance mechanosensitive channel